MDPRRHPGRVVKCVESRFGEKTASKYSAMQLAPRMETVSVEVSLEVQRRSGREPSYCVLFVGPQRHSRAIEFAPRRQASSERRSPLLPLLLLGIAKRVVLHGIV
ncbi:hypothetical protein PI124_g6788 [Phytophthora idaei]|nr:hypothetical protein PI125_g5703 [Phytophthora idaei]KAG3162152.1 hypothetical protein PI126_g6112 [Phytophthora idaei]KAG3248556.1 hypothetical protein PI124_g6788 [Phytophthora idaei]